MTPKIRKIVLFSLFACALFSLVIAPFVSKGSASQGAYNHISTEDVRIASSGVDAYNKGDFELAARQFKQAIALAEKRGGSSIYINDLKLKLGTTLIVMEKFDEGQAVLQELYGAAQGR